MRQTELFRERKMKQKIAAVFCAAILLTVLCAACKSKELPDTYVEGSDYQYMQMEGGMYFTLTKAQGGKGMYFLHVDYIYILDEEANTILPLCNKADCLPVERTAGYLCGGQRLSVHAIGVQTVFHETIAGQ